MDSKDNSLLFITLIALNITLILISNIITSKIILIFGLIFTAGDILFPLTYILNDIFVEVYGYKKAKFTILISFICNLIMTLIFIFAVAMPYPSYWNNQNAFETILLFTPRILCASFLAYIIGSFINAKIMIKMKTKNEKHLYKRTILSTIIGELFDTTIFTTITFINTINLNELISLNINVYILKVLIEILFTPLTCFIINKIKKLEELL